MTPPPAVTKRPRRARLIFAGLALCAVGSVAGVYLYQRGSESTDNAQVEGHLVSVSSRITGQVAAVPVEDNREVQKGDLLVQLDRADMEARELGARADLASARAGLAVAQAQRALTQRTVDANLAQAQGGVTQASAGLGSSKAGVDQAWGEIAAATARLKLTEVELRRVERLRAEDALPQAELDAKQAARDQASAQLVQARAHLRSAANSTGSWVGSIKTARGRLLAAQTGPEQLQAADAAVDLARARVAQAQAALKQVELNLSYTEIRAPQHGVVSHRAVEVGHTVSPDRPLLVLVPLDDVWVTANFKEGQIAAIKKGQPVRVHVDAYPGSDLPGQVDSVAGAAGSRFSVLPPDNTSGNFVKVVQRIPVLIKLAPPLPLRLLPGMSATAVVRTGR